MNRKSQNIATLFAGALVSSLALGAAITHAADRSPFSVKPLAQGYLLAEADMPAGGKARDGKCGEGKCGANKKKAEAKCGADKKAMEGKCGAEKKAADGKCGVDAKHRDGSCGADKS